MSWRDQLRPAQLGVASFMVESVDGALGRNTQVHEYPLRDQPFVEDLGRRARRFTLDAYVIGPQYMAARDALIAQIEKPGPTRLVHPWLGELQVSVVECQGPRESTREGGMARFSITVIESGDRVFPSADVDTAANVAEQAHTAALASMESFNAEFSAVAAPAFVASSATDLVRGFTDHLRGLVRTVTTVPGPIAELLADLTDLSGAVSSLILVPQTLSSRIASLVESIDNIVDQPQFALDIARSLFNFGDDLPAPSTQTPSRARESQNQVAFVGLIQTQAVIAGARITAQIQFAAGEAIGASAFANAPQYRTFEDVNLLRDELIGQLDAKAEAATSDALYYALVDVRTAIVMDLQTRAAPLARIVALTLPESAPTLAVAYDLYGDATLDREVIARNLIRDPNFAPGGRVLQVFSDA